MLSCKEVTEICSRELELPLELGEKISFRMHLMMCTGCTNYRKQMSLLRRFSKAYADGRAVNADPDQDLAA